MKFVILDPSTQIAQLVDDPEGHVLPGREVLEVADDFTWRAHVVDWTTLSIQSTDAGLWDALRQERNLRLAACDWTQTADQAEAVQLLWRPYRQALKDLPENTADPAMPSWPVPPA